MIVHSAEYIVAVVSDLGAPVCAVHGAARRAISPAPTTRGWVTSDLNLMKAASAALLARVEFRKRPLKRPLYLLRIAWPAVERLA